MRETKFWYGFISEESVENNSVRMHFVNNELNGFAAWLLNTGCQAKIEKPSLLLTIVRHFIQGSYDNYIGTSE